MVARRNIDVRKGKSESRENYFEAIEKEFVAGNGELVEIAQRKDKEWKLSFFDKVKDFFKNPYAGIKYFSSRLFGEKIAEFMYNLDAARKNLDDAKSNAIEVAKTGVDEIKSIVDTIKKEAKSIPALGPALGSAMKIKDYLLNNSDEAAKMPKDESERMEWWKEIMKKAGVPQNELVNKSLLKLLANKNNWENVKKNLKDTFTGEETEKRINKEIDTGEFYKDWPFTGDKLGATAESGLNSIKNTVSDMANIVGDNKELSTTLSAYLTYKTGIATTVGAAGTLGKLILSSGLAPVKFMAYNPKKVIALYIGGMLIRPNTKWDDVGMKVLYNTPLPKDYDEFMEVTSKHPVYKEAMQGMNISRKEFEEAMGIIKSEKELKKNIDEITSSITVNNVLKSALGGVGQTPKERLKYQNFRGYELVRSSVLSEKNSLRLKERMGERDYLSFSKLVESILLDARNDELGEVDKKLINKFNKYQAITGYEIDFGSENYSQLIFKSGDPAEESIIRYIGVNPSLDQSTKEDLSFTLKLNEDSIIGERGKSVSTFAAIGNAPLLKLREMLGVAGEMIQNDSQEKLVKDLNKKVKKGEAIVVNEGDNFFYKYGKEYVLLPYTVGEAFVNAAMNEDYEVKHAAQVFAGGLVLRVGFGTAKGLGKLGLDKAYGAVVHNSLSGKRVADKSLRKTAIRGFKTITYPISMIYDARKAGLSFREALRENGGLKKIISRSDASIVSSSLRNIAESSRLQYDRLRTSKLIYDEETLKTLYSINETRKRVVKMRDVKIFTNDILNRYPKGLDDSSKEIVGDLISKLRKNGFSDDLLKILDKKNFEALETVDELSASQLKQILAKVEVALKVEKDILGRLRSVVSFRDMKVMKKINVARDAQKAAQANRITKATRSMKLAKYGVGGALLGVGAYSLSGTNEDENTKIDSNEKFSEEMHVLANEVLIADDNVLSNVFNFKKLKTLVTSEDYDERKDIVNGAKNEYLKSFNTLVNTISRNNKSYKGNIDVLARLLKKRSPHANYKIETESSFFGGERKILNLGVGTIQIIQNSDGSLELGRQPVDLLENNLTSIGVFMNEGYSGIGMSLLPFVGTYKDFEQGYDAYRMGNDELMAEKVSFGVSGLATDFLLGAKAVAMGGKLIGKADDFKKLQKFVEFASSASDFSKVSKGVSKASRGASIGAAGALGLSLLNGDIETFVKMDNG